MNRHEPADRIPAEPIDRLQEEDSWLGWSEMWSVGVGVVFPLFAVSVLLLVLIFKGWPPW